MLDLKRLMIAGIIASCFSLVGPGGDFSRANSLYDNQQTVSWIWPANGIITDLYGTRRGVHKGIDIAAKAGTPIYAVEEGVVSKSYYSQSYGNVVFVKHKNNYETVYAHLKSRDVGEGKNVKQGEVIGRMGNTGDSSGVHLHFEIHKHEWTFDKRNAVNPVVAFGDVGVGKSVATNLPKVLEVSGQTNRRYIVRPGDTLMAISRKTSTTVQDIKELNHLSSDKIIPMQVLIVQ